MSVSGDRIKKMLPKTYSRRLVSYEIRVALLHFKDLEPAVARYVYNDGTIKNLMSLTGTIPVLFQEKTYDIPVSVWLEENYPQSAPICYVTPRREMMLLRGNYVSTDSAVTFPLLDEWKAGECSLVGLLQVMTAVFGEEPPVCMKPQPEPQQIPCGLQCNRQNSMVSKFDGIQYLCLPTEDGHNETTC